MNKTCSNPACEEPVKPVARFYNSKHTKDGKQAQCIDCMKAGVKRSRNKNRFAAILYNMKRELRMLEKEMGLEK